MELVYLETKELRVSPFNSRRSGTTTKLKELAESIRELGVLTPLLISPKNKIFDGQLLWEATRLANFKYKKEM